MQGQSTVQQRINSTTIDITDVTNVAAGRVAKISMRNGFLYHDLLIKFSGVTLAQLKQIRVKLNDEIIYRGAASFFDVMDFYENGTDAQTTGVLQIPFSRFGLSNLSASVLTGINVGDADPVTGALIAELSVEIEVDPAAAAPAFKVQARVGNTIVGAGPGYVRRIFDTTLTGVVVARREITDLAPIGVKSSQRMYLDRIFLNIAPSSVERIRAIVNRREEQIIDPKINEKLQLKNWRKPVAGWIIIDRSVDGLGENFWRLIDQNLEEFRLEVDVTTAPAGGLLPYFAEYIGAYQ